MKKYIFLLVIIVCNALPNENYLGKLYGSPQQAQESPEVALLKAQGISTHFTRNAFNAINSGIPVAYKSLAPISGAPERAAANTRQLTTYGEDAARSGQHLTYADGLTGTNWINAKEQTVNKLENAASEAENRAKNTKFANSNPGMYADNYSHLLPWGVGQGLPEDMIAKVREMAEAAQANVQLQQQQQQQQEQLQQQQQQLQQKPKHQEDRQHKKQKHHRHSKH